MNHCRNDAPACSSSNIIKKRAWRDLTACFWLKSLGTPVFMTVFFMAYFAVLGNPLGEVTVLPALWPDRLVGFEPWALIPYVSLWVYVCLPSAFMPNFRELLVHALGALVLSVVGIGIFYFWPTSTPPSGIDWADHPSIEFLKAVDASGNACPSLHVAFSWFAMVWIDRLLRRHQADHSWRIANIIWAVAIVYSTMATKQHVFIDVLAGTILAAALIPLNLRWGSPSAAQV